MSSPGVLPEMKVVCGMLTSPQRVPHALLTASRRRSTDQSGGTTCNALREHCTNSFQTDATRASDLELHIQNRVKQELKRLESEQNKALKELHEKLQEPESNKSSTPKDKPDLGRQTVQKEIDELRKRLSQRRLKEEIASDNAVEKAKDEMVTCLRMNDRRPLDCWKEVDAFKSEVARLERQFIGKVLE